MAEGINASHEIASVKGGLTVDKTNKDESPDKLPLFSMGLFDYAKQHPNYNPNIQGLGAFMS